MAYPFSQGILRNGPAPSPDLAQYANLQFAYSPFSLSFPTPVSYIIDIMTLHLQILQPITPKNKSVLYWRDKLDP